MKRDPYGWSPDAEASPERWRLVLEAIEGVWEAVNGGYKLSGRYGGEMLDIFRHRLAEAEGQAREGLAQAEHQKAVDTGAVVDVTIASGRERDDQRRERNTSSYIP